MKADSVSLKAHLDSLAKLPEGARYTARSGRASVAMERRESVVYVWAACDSLERLVFYYRSQMDSLEQRAANMEMAARQATTRAERIERRSGARSIAAALIVMFGVLACVLVMVRVKNKH